MARPVSSGDRTMSNLLSFVQSMVLYYTLVLEFNYRTRKLGFSVSPFVASDSVGILSLKPSTRDFTFQYLRFNAKSLRNGMIHHWIVISSIQKKRIRFLFIWGTDLYTLMDFVITQQCWHWKSNWMVTQSSSNPLSKLSPLKSSFTIYLQ